jgi:hypothetical protein
MAQPGPVLVRVLLLVALSLAQPEPTPVYYAIEHASVLVNYTGL